MEKATDSPPLAAPLALACIPRRSGLPGRSAETLAEAEALAADASQPVLAFRAGGWGGSVMRRVLPPLALAAIRLLRPPLALVPPPTANDVDDEEAADETEPSPVERAVTPSALAPAEDAVRPPLPTAANVRAPRLAEAVGGGGGGE